MTSAWRMVGVLVGVLTAGAAQATAQTCDLRETVQEGDCFHVQLEMKLEGKIHIRQQGNPVSLPLNAQASHGYAERTLAITQDGLVGKAARSYALARAVISVNTDRTERVLRPERRLIVAQRPRDQALVYSPQGSLTREELDVVAYHFDSLYLAGLLAGKEVKVGDDWKVAPHLAQAMGNFEGVTESSLAGKLDGLNEKEAIFSITGAITGIDAGSLVKATVEAKGTFDLSSRRITGLEWKQKDEREQGPASPASTVEAVTRVVRKSIETPELLNDLALVPVPEGMTPPAPMLQLEYRDPKGRFGLQHTREWHLVGQTTEHTVLRLLDRGDFVAQATIAPWTQAEKGKHLSPEEFQAAVSRTPGWEPSANPLQMGEVPSGDDRWIYRFSTLGQLDGVEVMQNFYLVAAPDGSQVVVTITLAPKQAEKLGARDISLVASLEVPAGKK